MKKSLLVLSLSMFLLVTACGDNENVKSDNQVSSTSTTVGSDLFGSGGSDKMEAGDLQTIRFEYDKANLTTGSRTVLENNATWLKDNTNVFIQVEGHCDERGSIEYNLALGEKRALNVRKYLKKLGVPNQRVTVISYGEERPFCMDENDSCWNQNRRANFVVISK